MTAVDAVLVDTVSSEIRHLSHLFLQMAPHVIGGTAQAVIFGLRGGVKLAGAYRYLRPSGRRGSP
jgi:hypothetical protein